jgi:hypothetical protein
MTDKTISLAEANYAITQQVVQLAAETLARQAGIDHAAAILSIHSVTLDMMISTAAGPTRAICTTRVDIFHAQTQNDPRALKKAITAYAAAIDRFYDQVAARAAKNEGVLN